MPGSEEVGIMLEESSHIVNEPNAYEAGFDSGDYVKTEDVYTKNSQSQKETDSFDELGKFIIEDEIRKNIVSYIYANDLMREHHMFLINNNN